MKREEMKKLFREEYETNPRNGKPRRVWRYTGTLYRTDPAAVRPVKKICALLWLLALAAFVSAGMVYCGAQRCVYVMPFFALTILALFRLLVALISAWHLPDSFDALRKEECFDHGTSASVMLGVFGTLWLVGDLVYLLLNSGGTGWPNEAIFALCGAVCAAAGWMCYHQWKKLPVEELPNQEEDA